MALNATVYIRVEKRAGNCISSGNYFTQPFKVMNITEDKEGLLKLMLMSSSPGILDGDFYKIRIDVDKGASLELLSQSYQRIFTMKNGATQHTEVHLEEDSFFKYIPHPVVPHSDSKFFSNNKIYLAGRCSLIWGEVLTCGRKLNGEVFKFTSYQSVTEIYAEGRLKIKENLLMQPDLFASGGMGQLEGFTHQATLIFLHPDAVTEDLIATISGYLDIKPNIIYGITNAAISGIILRILGHKAEQLYDCLQQVSLIIQPAITLKA